MSPKWLSAVGFQYICVMLMCCRFPARAYLSAERTTKKNGKIKLLLTNRCCAYRPKPARSEPAAAKRGRASAASPAAAAEQQSTWREVAVTVAVGRICFLRWVVYYSGQPQKSPDLNWLWTTKGRQPAEGRHLDRNGTLATRKVVRSGLANLYHSPLYATFCHGKKNSMAKQIYYALKWHEMAKKKYAGCSSQQECLSPQIYLILKIFFK